MNCTYLRGAIEEAVSTCGYTLTEGAEHYLPTSICTYPAAHLLPPEFHSIEGRNHGKITYSIELRLFHQGAKLSPSERSERLDAMEVDMVEIFTLLSNYERVLSVEDLTIAPASTVDNHGAVAMVAKADIVTYF